MKQTQQHVVRLESSRSNIGLALFVMVPITVAVAAFGLFLLRHAAKGGSDFWSSLGFGLACMAFSAFFARLATTIIRKLHIPDVLEFSPDGFHYLSVVDGKDVSAPWNEVGAPEKRPGGKIYFLHVDVGGQPQSFPDGYWNLSMDTMMGLINSARKGHVISPAQWLVDHPEPDETKAALMGIGAGLAGAALIGGIIVLTAHH